MGHWCLSGGRGAHKVPRRVINTSSPKKRRGQKTNSARRRSALGDHRLRIRQRQTRCRDRARRRRVAVMRLHLDTTRISTAIIISTDIGNTCRLWVAFQLLLLLLPRKPHPPTLPPVQISLPLPLHPPPQSPPYGHFGPDLRTHLRGMAARTERCRWNKLLQW